MSANEREQHTAVYAIDERSFALAVRIVRLAKHLARAGVDRALTRQLLRSGTSVGANVTEAQAAQSRRDFIAKMSVAHNESREARYWLRLIGATEATLVDRLTPLQQELDEVGRILASILKRTKENNATPT